MQQSEEAAAESESQRRRSLRIVSQRGVVQLQFFQSVAQLREVVALHRVKTAIDHRFHRLVTGKRLFRRPGDVRHRIADARFVKRLDARRKVPDFPHPERIDRRPARRKDAHLFDRIGSARRHHSYRVARAHGAVHDADIADDAAIVVVNGVEDQRLQRRAFAPPRRGDASDDLLQNVPDADAFLGAAAHGLRSVDADHVFDLAADFLRARRGQIDFVQNREHRQIVIDRLVSVRQRLRLDSLRGIHDKQRAFAGRQRARHFVAEIDVPRRVDQVQHVRLPVGGTVIHAHGHGFDGDAPLPLDRHVVEDLLLHVPFGDRSRRFQQPVSDRGLAVVDMSDN